MGCSMFDSLQLSLVHDIAITLLQFCQFSSVLNFTLSSQCRYYKGNFIFFDKLINTEIISRVPRSALKSDGNSCNI